MLIPEIFNEVHTKLAPLVNGRVHPVTFVEPPTYPALRYAQIANEPNNVLGGETNLDRIVLRVDVFCHDYPDALALSRRVRDVMNGLSVPGLCVGETDLYEEDERLYHRALDFDVWVYRPNPESSTD